MPEKKEVNRRSLIKGLIGVGALARTGFRVYGGTDRRGPGRAQRHDSGDEDRDLRTEEQLGIREDLHGCRHNGLGRDAQGRRQGLRGRGPGGGRLPHRPGSLPCGAPLAGQGSFGSNSTSLPNRANQSDPETMRNESRARPSAFTPTRRAATLSPT